MKNIIVLMLLVSAGLVAQDYPADAPLIKKAISFGSYFRDNYSLKSQMFNPENLQMGHSMSFSTAVSSQRDAAYESTYTNHLKYSFNSNLDLYVDVDVSNFGTANLSKNYDIKANDDNQTKVLPSFMLNYRPSENTTIQIGFSRQAYQGSSPFGSRGDMFLHDYWSRRQQGD